MSSAGVAMAPDMGSGSAGDGGAPGGEVAAVPETMEQRIVRMVAESEDKSGS